METPANMGSQVAGSTLRLCGVGVCVKDGMWQCWSLCSSSSLVLVPVLSLLGYRESCLPESNDKERSGGACLWLVDLLVFLCLANTNMTLCVIAALVFYSSLIIALFWASEERWEVEVQKNKKSYRNHLSPPFQLLFLLSEKIAEWLGCLLCKIS